MLPYLALPVDLLFVSLFIVAVSGVHLRWARSLMPHDMAFQGLAACGVGLFCFSLGMYFLGVMGLYRAEILWPILILLLILGVKPWVDLQRDIQMKSVIHSEPWRPFEIGLLLILATAAIMHLLYNYTPPAGEDELVYHISLPSRYIRWHRLAETPYTPNGYFPLNTELIYTALLLVRNVYTVKVMVWASGLLTVGALFLFSRKSMAFSRQNALLTAALFYTLPCVTSLNATVSSDQMNLFYEVVCLGVLWKWFDQPQRALLGVAAILAGAGMGTRPYAVGWVFAVIVLIFWIRRKPQDIVFFALIAGLLVVPWLVRSFWLTGNPFYPRALWPGAAEDIYFRAQAESFHSLGWKTLLMLPFSLSNGTLIWGIGPLPFSWAPFAWLGRGQRDIGRLIFYTLSVLLLTALIPMTLVNPRYFSQSFPWLCILAVSGWSLIQEPLGPRFRVILKVGMIGVIVCPGLLLSVYFGAKRLPFFLGRQSQADYLEAHYPEEGYAMMRYINREISPAAPIFVLGAMSDPPYFYYPTHRLIPMNAYPPRFYDKSSRELADAFKKAGYQYVLLDKHDFRINPDGSQDNLYLPSLRLHIPELSGRFFKKEFETPQSALYQLL